jgi:hypothetical protein
MQLIRNRIVLAKVETSYGVDAVPTIAANALAVRKIMRNTAGSKFERDLVRKTLSPMPPLIGLRYADVAIDVELKGGGSVGVAGALSALFQACAFSETVSAGSSVVYLPSSNNQKSLTLYIYDLDSTSTVLHKILGCVGSLSLKLVAGNIAVLTASLKGLYSAPTDAAFPGTPVYEASTPPLIESAAFAINAISSLIVKEVSIDMANEIVQRDDVSSSNGIKGFQVAGRKPKGQFNPEATQIATYDPYTDWNGSTPRALTIQIGSVAGNKILITAPAVVLDEVKDADQSGVLAKDLPITFGQSAGDDEVCIKFQ